MENTTSSTADRKLLISRTINAPADLVWEVWMQPEDIPNWWGPDGFTSPINRMDVSAGGEWNLVMYGPDGTDYQNKSVFKEVVMHKKIAFEHIAPKFTAAITFEALDDKTDLTWRMFFESRE